MNGYYFCYYSVFCYQCILLLQCIPVQNKHDQNRRRKKPAGQKQSQKTTQKSSQNSTKQKQKSVPAETEKQQNYLSCRKLVIKYSVIHTCMYAQPMRWYVCGVVNAVYCLVQICLCCITASIPEKCQCVHVCYQQSYFIIFYRDLVVTVHRIMFS